MPVSTIPLVFSPNQRGPIITSSSAPTKDARMVRCFQTVIPNPIAGTKEAPVEKIPGFASSSTPGGSNSGTALFVTQAIQTVAAFGTTASTVYVNGTDITASDPFADTVVSVFTSGFLDGIEHIFWQDAGGVPWYLPIGDPDILLTAYTADGNNSTTITDIKDIGGAITGGLYPGQVLSAATNIQADTRVVSVDYGAGSAVLSLPTTGGAFNDLAITKKPIAYMNNSAFVTYLSTAGGVLAGNFVEMDGYVFITATSTATASGIIIQSDLNTVSFTPLTNFITPNYQDLPSGVIKYRDYLVYLGVNSVQFFRNAGNPSGSVLNQIDELSIVGLGCVGGSGNSGPMMTLLGGTVYWMGLTNGVISGIYRLNGFSAEPISNDAVTRQLTAVIAGKQSSDVVAFDGFSMFGKHFLYVGLGSIGYLYCVETNQWTEAGFFSGGMRLANSLASTANPLLYGVRMTGNTGKIYVMDKSNLTHQDDSAAYTMTIQTPELVLNDGQPFTVHQVELIGDTQASGLSTLSSCDDDYTTFTVRGAFDMTAQRKVIHRCGHYKNHVAFKIENSANTAFRAQALKIHWSPAVGRGFR